MVRYDTAQNMNNNQASLVILTKMRGAVYAGLFISLAVLGTLLTLVLFAVKLRIDMRIVLVVDQEQSLLDLELASSRPGEMEKAAPLGIARCRSFMPT